MSETATEKALLWTKELFPEAFERGHLGSEYYTAAIFFQGAHEALGGLVHVTRPAIMEGLQRDQIDDTAISYGIRKALDYRQQYFPES